MWNNVSAFGKAQARPPDGFGKLTGLAHIKGDAFNRHRLGGKRPEKRRASIAASKSKKTMKPNLCIIHQIIDKLPRC